MREFGKPPVSKSGLRTFYRLGIRLLFSERQGQPIRNVPGVDIQWSQHKQKMGPEESDLSLEFKVLRGLADRLLRQLEGVAK